MLFTSLFALLGVAFVFGSLSIIIDVIQQKARRLSDKAAKDAVAKSFAKRDKTNNSVDASASGGNETVPELVETPAGHGGMWGMVEKTAGAVSDQAGAVSGAAWRYYKQSSLLKSLVWMIAVMSIGIIFVYVVTFCHRNCCLLMTSLCFTKVKTIEFLQLRFLLQMHLLACSMISTIVLVGSIEYVLPC